MVIIARILFLLVLLDVPDTVLIERVMGKRIDPVNGGLVYLSFKGAVK